MQNNACQALKARNILARAEGPGISKKSNNDKPCKGGIDFQHDRHRMVHCCCQVGYEDYMSPLQGFPDIRYNGSDPGLQPGLVYCALSAHHDLIQCT